MTEQIVNEEWLPAPGFEGSYEVSSLGNLRSIARMIFPESGKPYMLGGRILKLSTHQGYRYGIFRKGGKNFTARAGRLVALAFLKMPPGMEADHIDMNRSNDHISNLRISSASQNIANTKARKNNQCGLKGASLNKVTGRWRARIKVGYKEIHIGNFDSAEEAHAAYCVAATVHFGEFARYD